MRLLICNMAISAALLSASAGTILHAEDANTAEFDFLDYLGQMLEEENGKWLDPMAMETIVISAEEETHEKTHEEPDQKLAQKDQQ